MVDVLWFELSQQKKLLFFLLAILIFIFPLLLADSFYIDDSWRSHFAGMAWKGQGRILAEWFYQGLSFSGGAPNMFPLPLLVSAVAMSFALRSLTNHYFTAPNLVCCLVVLPLWYSPFFLQNLSYQYDGPAMVLGMVAVIYAITFKSTSLFLRVGVPAVCIAVGLSFYQIVISVYLGLCCIELVRIANDSGRLRDGWVLVRDKIVHFLLGLILYRLTAFQFLTQERTALRELGNGWQEKLVQDVHVAAQHVSLLYTDGNAWLCWSIIVIALFGLLQVMYRVLRRPVHLFERIVMVALCLLAVVLAGLAVPGVILIFRVYDDGARLLMGASSAGVLVFYLVYRALISVHIRLGVLLIIPLIAILSFSYAYGRVMALQKELSTSVMQTLSYDLMSNTALAAVQHYYLIYNPTHEWLDAASGSFKLMPALKYVLNVDFLLLPEMLPRSTGIANISSIDGEKGMLIRQRYSDAIPLIERKFYRIFVAGHDSYIVLKTPSADSVFQMVTPDKKPTE